MRRLLIAGAMLIAIAGAGLMVFAPYLPQLVMEGAPSLIWREAGQYAPVKGAVAASDFTAPAIDRLDERLQAIFSESGGTALLVAQQGQLRLEHYATGDTAATRFNSFSMAKSLVGALMFKALEEGKIGSFDQTLADLLPEAPGLAKLTLRRILTMRSGVHFDSKTASFGGAGSVKDSDTFPNPFGPLARLHFQGLAAIVGGLTMDETPSDIFNYQNVNTALLGAVLERAYGQPLEQLVSEKIWAPAGAADAVWRKPAAGSSVSAYCCLYGTARDWVRVGLFFAANGTPSHPFLPEPMWREFLGLDVSVAERAKDHYGNHTLQNVLDRSGERLQGPFSYFMGQNGQVLYIMPEQQLVVYRSGERSQLLHSTLYEAWNSVFPQ